MDNASSAVDSGEFVVSGLSPPAWLAASPFYRLANALHADIVSRYFPLMLPSASSPMKNIHASPQQQQQSRVHPSGYTTSNPLASLRGVAVSHKSLLGDLSILCEPRVVAFLQYAVPSSCSGVPNRNTAADRRVGQGPSLSESTWSSPSDVLEINFKTAPSIASVFHFLALCKTLPPQATRGLYVEGAALFVAIMRSVNTSTLTFRQGVDEVEFLQYVIACMVQLRITTTASNEGGPTGGLLSDVGYASIDKKMIDDALSHAFPPVTVRPSTSLPDGGEGSPGHDNKKQVGCWSWSTSQRNVVLAVVRGLNSAARALLDEGNVSARAAEDTLTACVHRSPSEGQPGVPLPIQGSLWSELIATSELLADVCCAPHIEHDEEEGPTRDDNARHLGSWSVTTLTELMGVFCFAVEAVGSTTHRATTPVFVMPSRLLRVLRRVTSVDALRAAIKDDNTNSARLSCAALLVLLRAPPSEAAVVVTSPLASHQEQRSMCLLVDVLDEWCDVLQDLYTLVLPSDQPSSAAAPAARSPSPRPHHPSSVNAVAALLCARMLHILTHSWIVGMLGNAPSTVDGTILTRDTQRVCSRLAQGGDTDDIALVLASSFPMQSLGEGAVGCLVRHGHTAPQQYANDTPSESLNGSVSPQFSEKDPRCDPEVVQGVTARVQRVLRMDVSARGPYGIVRESISPTSPPNHQQKARMTVRSVLGCVFADCLVDDPPAAPTNRRPPVAKPPTAEASCIMSSSPLSAQLLDEMLFLDVSRTVGVAVHHLTAACGEELMNASSLSLALSSMASELFLRGLGRIQQDSVDVASNNNNNHNAASDFQQRRNSSGGTPVDFDGVSQQGLTDNSISIPSAVVVARALCGASSLVRRQLVEEISDVLATKRNVVSSIMRQHASATAMPTRANTSESYIDDGTPTTTKRTHNPIYEADTSGGAPAAATGPWLAQSQQFCLAMLARIAVVDDVDAVLPHPVVSGGSSSLPSIGSSSLHRSSSVSVFLSKAVDTDALDRVLQLICESIENEISEEVRRGRMLASASSVASSVTPMYVGQTFECFVHLLARIGAAVELRLSQLTSFILQSIIRPADAAQNAEPCTEWRSLIGALRSSTQNGRSASSRSDGAGGDDDGDGLQLRGGCGSAPVHVLLTKGCLSAFASCLANDSAVLDKITVAVVHLSMTLGWPASGTLFQGFRGDVSSLRSVGVVLQTLMVPLLTVIAHTQQMAVVAARCSGLIDQLRSLSHTEHSYEILRRRLGHIHRWWPPSSGSFGENLWSMEASSDLPDCAPVFAYALSEASAFPWRANVVSMQVQRFRSFWLMLAMHNITSGTVDHIIRASGLTSSEGKSGGRAEVHAFTPPHRSSSTVSSAGLRYGRMHQCPFRCALLLTSIATTTSCCTSAAIAEATRSAFRSIHLGGETGAASAIALPLRMLAVCVPPLIHLRSAECQQALAEGITFERQFISTSSQTSMDEVRRDVQRTLAALCPPVASIVNRSAMTFSELALLRTIFEASILRASSGPVHPLAQYAQVELREFVSSKDLLDAIPLCLAWAHKLYLATQLDGRASSATRVDAIVVHDASVLVQLAAIAVPSVRRQAIGTLDAIFSEMPHMCAEPRILSVLLHTLNLVQTGDEEELATFSEGLHLRHITQASSGPYDTERHTIHDTLLKAAHRWLRAAKGAAPHRLFDSAIRFLTEEHDEHRNLLGTAHYGGTELAIRSCLGEDEHERRASSSTMQMKAAASSWADVYSGLVPMEARAGILALASSRLRNYSSTMMRRSRATGAIDGAARHAVSISFVEQEHLVELQHIMRQVLESLSRSPQLSERLIVKLASCQRHSASASNSALPHPRAPSVVDIGGVKGSLVLFIRAFDSMANMAALIEANHVSRRLLPSTLRYLVQAPVQTFQAPVLHLATGAWKWILTCGSFRSRLDNVRVFLSNLCTALEWTATQRLGLFDGAPHTKRVVVETGCSEQAATAHLRPLEPGNGTTTVDGMGGGGDGAASPTGIGGSNDADAALLLDQQDGYAADYRSNSPHKILLAFLAEHFVDWRLPIAHDRAVLRLLLRTVLVWTRDPNLWSLKDASFGEYMRGVLFCLHVITTVHHANKRLIQRHSAAQQHVADDHVVQLVAPYSVLVTARSRVNECLLRWFSKSPPAYYMTQEAPNAVKNELHVLEELITLVGREQDHLSHSQRGFLPVEHHSATHGGRLDAVSVPSSATALRRRAVGTSDSPASSNGIESSRHRASSGAGGGRRGDGSVVGVGTVAVTETFKKLHNTLGLLRFLLRHEAQRLRLWADPRSALEPPPPASGGNGSSAAALLINDISQELWKAYCNTAAAVMPDVLVGLLHRFPSNPHVARHASLAIASNPAAFAHLPSAVDTYLHAGTLHAGAEHLYLWANCSIVQALRFLGPTFQSYPHVVRYAIRSLLSADSNHLIFYLPQLLQCYATDHSHSIERFFRAMCHKSTEFTHQLLWCLQTEGEGSSVLASKSNTLADSIRALMTPQQYTFYKNEFQYVNAIISVSGVLKPVEKAKRKEQLRRMLQADTRSFHEPIPKNVLYLPTNPNFRITKIIPHTAGAMQSAAKCPILVQFEVTPRDPESTLPPPPPVPVDLSATVNDNNTNGLPSITPLKKACIFKMGDDCRQDQIALQLITYIQRILRSVNVPCFLHPYRVVTTGSSSGVIECVPNAMSRDQIGKLVESNIAEYFVQTYGPPQSPAFRQARLCFIQSMASYSVASFILNIKDRHNGNIMFDSQGHLIHIDFGFIFDFSPGGDMNFESSPFKLTQEMLQLMGDTVTGKQTIESSELSNALIDPESYETFVRLTVLCYLAVRQHAKEICVLVELMLSSGLPCFKPKKTIADLSDRLSLHRTEVEAAAYMFDRVLESRDNMRTRLYDRYQNIAEGIEM